MVANAADAEVPFVDARDARSDATSTTSQLIEQHGCDDVSIVDNSKENARLVRQSRVLAVGAVGIFSAYSGVVNLQSSLNFDQSIGITSLAIVFGTSILMNATVVPILLQLLCPKTLLLVSELTFLVYTIANLYPATYTLYPGAILLGIGESIIWPSLTMFNSYFGSRSADCEFKETPAIQDPLKRQCAEDELRQLRWRRIQWFTGKFFAIFAVYQIVGNLMAYAILVLDPTKTKKTQNTSTEGDYFTNASQADIFENPHTCGARDCYEYQTTDSNETSVLNVGNVTLKYALFTGYGLLQIVALVFHKFLLDGFSYYKEANRNRGPSMKIVSTLVIQILRHMASPLQLLLAPMNIYNGMMMGFVFSDFTRSYVACPLGVKEVGLAMTFFGVSNALGSLVFQFFAGKLGRTVFVLLFAFAEAGLLVSSLLWVPKVDSFWEVYILAACFGFPDSWRQASLTATYPEYFAGKENLAFSMLSLLTCVGYVIAFGIGTNVCVYGKIRILLFTLAFGFFCYIFGEFAIHRRGKCCLKVTKRWRT